ncbi:MAG: polysaccharide deacetylase family protein [Cyclobacteriaceae bacterium]
MPYFNTSRRNMIRILLIILSSSTFYSLEAQENNGSFQWPVGKQAALSLSFDDARRSNVDIGLELFRKLDTNVTFYVVPEAMKDRLDGWKEIVKEGHEIGNHTLVHPCSGNFAWSRERALEDYSLDSMRKELVKANQQIEELLGVTPISFAYTCGQTFVGRGDRTRSYVPLVNELFESGRGFRNESSNDPTFVDLAQLQGIECDGMDFKEDVLPILNAALENGSWVVLAGHEIGEGGVQTTKVKMLEELIAYVQRPNSGIWLAPVRTIASHIRKYQRLQNEK